MASIAGRAVTVSLRGEVPQWTGVTGVATLPATLANDRVSYAFVTHATYGVTLDTITQLDTAAAFAWTNAQASDDGTVTGQLWRVVTNPARETNHECNAECGGGHWSVHPDAGVDVFDGADEQGRPALIFRWLGLALQHGGTIDVTQIVALGEDDTEARWTIHVRRSGTEADGLEYVEAPILAIVGPVAARAATTHEDSQVRARVLLPGAALPALGSDNVPLSLWSGESVETHHPMGDELTTYQPIQACAVYAGDLQDAASHGRILLLGSADRRGWHKRFTHAGVLSGSTLIFRWAHRYTPAWADHPILDADSTDRFGNVFHASYPVLTACLEAPTASWCHTALAFYRDTVADAMSSTPKRHDTERTALARGAPFVIDRTTDFNGDAEAVAHIFETWAEEQREIAGADVVYGQLNNLNPAGVTRPVPLLAPNSFRGTNWLPMCDTWGHSLSLGLVPASDLTGGRPTVNVAGFFHEPFAEAAFDHFQTVGFNNVRLWGAVEGYLIDPVGYMASLKTCYRLAHERGIGITYILFNQIPAGAASGFGSAYTLAVAAADDAATMLAGVWTICNNWQNAAPSSGAPQHKPANELDTTQLPFITGDEWAAIGRFGEWSQTTFQAKVRDYIRDIATFLAEDVDGQQADHGVDLYNEVSIILGTAESPTPEREFVLDFVVQVERAMRTIHPGLVATVGWAGDPIGNDRELSDAGAIHSFLSQHGYAYTNTDEEFESIAAVLASRKVTADALSGGQLVFSEFYVVPENKNRMADYLAMISGLGVGGQSWCNLNNNAWSDRAVLGQPVGTFSWVFDGLYGCTTPALSITTSTTIEYRPFGGECNRECSRECSSGYTDDATAIEEWVIT